MSQADRMDEALAEMKSAGRPGVAIVAPDDDRLLGELSERLEALVAAGLPGSALFLCCTASRARERFGDRAAGSGPGGTR
jgi:hypothetical protein